jgi:hypothetical protein
MRCCYAAFALVLAVTLAPLCAQTTVRIDLAVGGGTWEHTTSGVAALSDDTDAGYGRLGFEIIGGNDFGGGLRLEGTVSDDDLFLGSGGLATEASDGDLFLHGTGIFGGTQDDLMRMPLRFGLFVRNYRIEEQVSSDSIDWTSVGPRIEIEPELRLVRGDDVQWSFYARAGGSFGVTTIETDLSSDSFDSTTLGFDFGLGTRLQLGPAQIDLGFLLRTQTVDESDDVGGLFIREIDAEFRGIVLGAAVVF